ncbi:MAG TPA: carboxypeptidase-like regulatory domain-containing protein [Bryobacteraceae bacterium]|nr:carboxypeptidase-like regulatory domain-containing protein [Bryobacteraceae bacterium]
MRYSILVLLSSALLSAQSQAPTTAILEGEILNSATGAPIPGARIRLGPNSEVAVYAKADPHGHFSFENLAPNNYSLSIESPGFQPDERLSINLSAKSSAPLRCDLADADIKRSTDANGTRHISVTLRLVPSAVITGKITDPDGFPVNGGSIELTRIEPFVPTCSFMALRRMYRANDQGEFRIAHLEAGSYYVVANKPATTGVWDSSYHPTYYPHALDTASAKAIKVVPGQEVRAI